MTDNSTDHGMEEALAAVERDADGAVRATASAHSEAKRVKAAAATGELQALRRALDAMVRVADQAAQTAREVRAGWTFDEQQHLASGAYTKEVLAVAAEQGLDAFESDERILSFPAIVSVSAADSTVVVDKRKDRRIRPSVLVRTLQALQIRPPKFKAQAFLESMAVAYGFAVANRGQRPGATVKLFDVYDVLTVMPGAAREYSRQEFARDLYLLDQSGETTTKDGRVLSLPASALTRGSGTLRTVSRSGQEKVYAGIAFEDPRS